MKKLKGILSRKVKEPQGGTSPNLSLHKGKKNSGFTLVELIIVITILAILATIAFVSFQNFSKDARDGNRLTTLKNIEKGLRLEYERNQKYPNPEGTTLEYGGNLIQGYAQDSISQKIGLNKPAKDPKNDNYYPYTVNGNQDKFQITGYLELENEIIFANNIFTQTYADTTTNYKDRYIVTFGDRLGYLYDPTTNAPLQEKFEEIDPDKEVGILFSNNSNDQTNTIASGSNLGQKLELGQSACELDNQIILQGQTIQAYNTNTYPFDDDKPTPIARTCNNRVLSGDDSYKYITITEQLPKNCEATSYSGYTVPQLNHNQIQELTKSITLGNKTIEASCYNGVLSYPNDEIITCDAGKAYDDSNKTCNENMCTGTQPDNTTLVGTQKYNIPWKYGHDTNSFCNYECVGGYYWDTNQNKCIGAQIGYIVGSNGQENQTACTDTNTYQDEPNQMTCKTVTPGYYSEKEGGVNTKQTICPVNTYCENGVKQSCPTGYTTNGQEGQTSCDTKEIYTITYVTNSLENPSIDNGSGEYGSTIIAPIEPTRTGYTFAGWYKESALTNAWNFTSDTMPASNITLYAKWDINSYTVTFDSNGGGTPSPATKAVNYNTAIGELATVSRTGYTFNGWYTAKTGGTKITTSTVITANITYYAQWTAIVNGACGTANGVARTTAPSANLCSAGAQTTVTTNAGTFTWSCNGINTGTNASCSAPRQYTVTFDSNGGGTPSPATKAVNYNTEIGALATISRTGYTFNGWYTAKTGGTKITTSTTVTANITYYAQWTGATRFSFDKGIKGTTGVVKDSVTGLMWQSEGVSGKNWEQAKSYCANLTLGGYTDWRLPNITELSSIVEAPSNKKDPSVDTTYFNFASAYYWSSTPNANSTSTAWLVDFNDGNSAVGIKSYTTYVVCTR